MTLVDRSEDQCVVLGVWLENVALERKKNFFFFWVSMICCRLTDQCRYTCID